MTYGVPTDVSTILQAIQAQIATTSALLPLERTYICIAPADSVERFPPADRWLTISPVRFEAIEGLVAGGGSMTFGLRGRCQIEVWNRLETDAPESDVDALTDPSNGILIFWNSVLAALQLFEPVNTAGQCILLEPMRLASFEIVPRIPQKPWLRIRSTWETKFNQSVE